MACLVGSPNSPAGCRLFGGFHAYLGLAVSLGEMEASARVQYRGVPGLRVPGLIPRRAFSSLSSLVWPSSLIVCVPPELWTLVVLMELVVCELSAFLSSILVVFRRAALGRLTVFSLLLLLATSGVIVSLHGSMQLDSRTSG